MVTNHGALNGPTVADVLIAVGLIEGQFKGESGHFSRLEYLDLDHFTPIKLNGHTFRVGRVYLRELYDSGR